MFRIIHIPSGAHLDLTNEKNKIFSDTLEKFKQEFEIIGTEYIFTKFSDEEDYEQRQLAKTMRILKLKTGIKYCSSLYNIHSHNNSYFWIWECLEFIKDKVYPFYADSNRDLTLNTIWEYIIQNEFEIIEV